jgi:8-oxo-dGTP pyrophosphatase MutT (NUDIX family)/HD superfamily phosphodiesterase
LKSYIEKEIFPLYSRNDEGHQLDHIQYVIDRSLRFASALNTSYCSKINYDMVYTIAAYHDIGHYVDPKRHEIISADMMYQDKNLRMWFGDNEMQTMFQAIRDHRASSDQDPESIYGKIVASADKNTSVVDILRRTYAYGRKNNPEMGWRQIMDEAYRHVCEKFGTNGYAVDKIYFEDDEYDQFLKHVKILIVDKDVFEKEFIDTNGLDKNALRNSIQRYVPFNEQEIIDKQTMLDFIDSFDDVVTRNNTFGHFTASAFVVNDHRTHALMLHHNIMGDFIYPGGHADGEYDLYSAALREVEEETGLKVDPMFDKQIFAIQAAPVKGHIKNGKYVSAHIHYDVLFVFRAKNEDMKKIRVLESENSQVEWRPITETWDKDVVDWARPVNRKIVQKMED